jgi:hypothetical protein
MTTQFFKRKEKKASEPDCFQACESKKKENFQANFFFLSD